MPPAARLTDMHTCPTGGGPVATTGDPTVLIAFLPAARMGDICTCAGPDMIVMGCPTVLIGGQMAARLGDPTAHGGVIVTGAPTVLIGLTAQAGALAGAAANGAPFASKCAT